jgi:phospholipid/cholesterol/gamma-HCH transport system substrate-binding protein
MENNRRTQIRVGIFLGLGLLAALISILALGGEKSLFRSYIRLNAKLEQVQGLATGSVVSLSGVTVGNIENIEFGDEPGSLRVVMKIDKRYQRKIPKDSTVEIRTQGALGDKFIYITPGSGSEIAENEDTLESARSTDLMGIIAEKGGEAGKIFDIITEFHKFMKIMNAEGRSERMMKNFADASANIKDASAEVKQLIAEMRNQNGPSLAASLKKLDSILSKVDRGEGTLGALINDPALHEQLKAVLGATPRKQYIRSILQNSIEKK